MSASAKKTKDFKRGSLFSFFAKKPAKTADGPAANAVPPPSSPSSSSKRASLKADATGGAGGTRLAAPTPTPTSPRADVEGATRRSTPTPKTDASRAPGDGPWKRVEPGSRIAVYWKDDRKHYACTVLRQRGAAGGPASATFYLKYDDGEHEWLDLSRERFKLLHGEDGEEDDDDEEEDGGGGGVEAPAGAKRRRRIQDDDDHDDEGSSEDEQEWQDGALDDDDDDDGSVFEAPDDDPNDDDEDDDGQWMVTDDEGEPQVKGGKQKRPKKKSRTAAASTEPSSSLKVTYHGRTEASSTASQKSTTATAVSSSTSSSSLSPVAAMKVGRQDGTAEEGSIAGSAFQTPLRSFSHTISPRTASSQKQKPEKETCRPASASAAFSRPKPSVPPSSSAAATPARAAATLAPPAFVRGAVNPRGAHVHNHLKFLQRPTDAWGRPPDHPQYDSRTLKVDPADWDAANGGKMTEAVQQWWDLKAQYYDTVLLFKTGMFYEMFHVDADIGVTTLGLVYMKGHVAHSGFPEISYGAMADRLVRAGYKVARVEQTETPEQLKRRNETRRKGSKAAKVVNREVCSVLTLGTRTFCALDDESALMSEESSKDGTTMNVGGCGPLLAICETLAGGGGCRGGGGGDSEDYDNPMRTNGEGEGGDDDDDDDDDDDGGGVRPVCEYGITLVDAIRGTVTLGQFADDVLRSRMHTLLTAFAPSEILVQGGKNAARRGASPALLSLLRAYQSNSRTPCQVECVQEQEPFPKSTALEPEHRRQLERGRSVVRPWDVQETLQELHRKRYYPRASRQAGSRSVARWPPVLKVVVEGEADLCLSSFGATLFYLQRNLIDHELLSMGIVKAYVPQVSPALRQSHSLLLPPPSQPSPPLATNGQSDRVGSSELDANPLYEVPQTADVTGDPGLAEGEEQATYMSLDGTTLHNLEILTNAVDFRVAGSLWGRINYTKSPHGARMLRAWLLRPLFRKADIDRRADAVQEMVGGAGNLALKEVRQAVLSRTGDLDRLLSRVHSMSVGVSNGANTDDGDEAASTDYHPNERAVLYCGPTYTKRKVGDFSKVLRGLRNVCQIPDIFAGVDIDQKGLLFKLVRLGKDGGCFPDMVESLDWYFENFKSDKAANGMFELAPGCDPVYDEARNTIQQIKDDLDNYKDEICDELKPKHVAKASWKYVNTKPDSKDKYLIELPAYVWVPHDFFVMGKRGSGPKQVNKYRTPVVEELVQELEQALEVREVRKAKGMQFIFARFDAQRSLWAAAAHATAILDALGSMSCLAGNSGYCRPEILKCPVGKQPSIIIKQGRHPCVENTRTSDFIPNDLVLGPQEADDMDSARLLLLSGPNMGGKSTMLRQTCLIAILGQIGSFVPAESCQLTPIDCIFTRLGASDRILLGQSTFFVELAETAAALRGATRRSLVIMDELGRGTSTFDGTAIASATVKHLVERCQCLTLFATHYHSLLDEWEHAPNVRLGHMESMVEENETDAGNGNIKFLYTLGEGACPKSFGINVAKLAGLPDEVLANAKRVSEEFEDEVNGVRENQRFIISDANEYLESVLKMVENADETKLIGLWDQLQPKSESSTP